MTNRDVKITLKAINKMGPAIRQAEAQMADFRNRVGADFKKWSMALGVVLIGALTASTVAGAQFEQSLANVGAVSRATAGEMAALEERARSLGGSTAFSAGEAAEAMYSLASGGLDVNETIAASEPVLKLAGATMSGMAEAAEITMASMAQFGLEATDSERIVNVFAAGIQNSTLNMQRLSDSMTYAGPVAASVGMNLEQTTAALGLLHNAGLKGSIAGTGLAMSLQKIIAPGKDLQAVLGSVSLEGDGFEAVIRKIEDANLSAGEMTKMFGPRTFKAIKALTTAGADGFAEMTEKLTGTNAVYEMYDRQMATTTSKFKILKSAIQENLIAVFFKIKPVLDEAIEAFTQFVQDVKPVVEELGVRLVAVFHEIWEKAQALFAFFVEHIETIKTVARAISAAVIAMYALSVAIGAVNAVMALSPIGWVVIGVGALFAAIAVLIDKTIGWQRAWIYVRTAGVVFWESFIFYMKILYNHYKGIGLAIKAFGLTLKVVFDAGWNTIKDFVVKAGDALENLGKIATDPLHAKDHLAAAKASAQDALDGSLEGVGDKITALWVDAGSEYVTGAENAARILKEKVAIIKQEMVDDLANVDSISDANNGPGLLDLYGTKQQPSYTMPDDFQFIQEQIPEDQGFMGPATPSPEQLQESLDAMEAVGDTGKEAMDLINDSAGQAMDGVTNAIADAVFEGKNLLESLGNVGKNIFSSIMTGFLKMGVTAGLGAMGIPLPQFAAGGSYPGGQLAIVGENGPELFYSGNSGTIVPNHGLKSMMSSPGGGGGGDVHIHLTQNLPSSSLLLADNRRMVRKFGEEILNTVKPKLERTYRGRKS